MRQDGQIHFSGKYLFLAKIIRSEYIFLVNAYDEGIIVWKSRTSCVNGSCKKNYQTIWSLTMTNWQYHRNCNANWSVAPRSTQFRP